MNVILAECSYPNALSGRCQAVSTPIITEGKQIDTMFSRDLIEGKSSNLLGKVAIRYDMSFRAWRLCHNVEDYKNRSC